MSKLITVTTFEDIHPQTNEYEDGQIFYCTEENKYYIKHGTDYHQTDMANLQMSIYEINKMIFEALPVIESICYLDNVLEAFDNFLKTTKNKYYMLYGQEISYFTLFDYCSNDVINFLDIINECLNNVGKIKDFTVYNDRVEIWITTHDYLTNEANTTCLLLFGYDSGVEKV